MSVDMDGKEFNYLVMNWFSQGKFVQQYIVHCMVAHRTKHCGKREIYLWWAEVRED